MQRDKYGAEDDRWSLPSQTKSPKLENLLQMFAHEFISDVSTIN